MTKIRRGLPPADFSIRFCFRPILNRCHLVEIQDGFRKAFGILLRRVVPDGVEDAALGLRTKIFPMLLRVLRRAYSIDGAVNIDRRGQDFWLRGQSCLSAPVTGITRRIVPSVAR